MPRRRLTPFAKLFITLLILAGLFFGGRYLLQNTSFGRDLMNQAENGTTGEAKSNDEGRSPLKDIFSKKDDDDVLKVQVFTWGGYAPGIYFNEGLEHSEHSRYWTDYGLKVDFWHTDDFDATRQAWVADEVHLLGNEVSAMATEMERLGKYDPQILMQVDWSRGGDAIIAKRGINTFNDLKGKDIAVTPSTPSQTFLIYALDAANLKMSDVNAIEVPSAIDAATAFKSGKVDAAVVWSPDDVLAIKDVPGSKVLVSTKEASHIIADVYMVKKSYAEKHPEKLAAFYEGWMKAAAEINGNKSNKEKAARILAEGMGLPVEASLDMMNNVYLNTHGDNLNFFGKNMDFKGVTGEKLYTQMGNQYETLGFAPANRPNWRAMAYTRAMAAADLTGPGHEAEGQKVFAPATAADKTKPALASKPVIINFSTGQYQLSENAKTIIDLQFANVATAYSNSRIRIEGNTDNVGARDMNMKLSRARAQSVARYLQETYDMDTNRFIIVGNGPDKPVPGCETNATEECKSKNRRTEFQLL
jgi:NitT/TauT family transport system substrate-binding protein